MRRPRDASGPRSSRPAHSSSRGLRLVLGMISVAGVMLACGFSTAARPATSSVSAQIKAADGGTLKHPNGATLTIPPHALAADATVTLTDSGPPVHAKGDPLVYASDAFKVGTTGANGKPVAFTSPALLTITTGTATIVIRDVIMAEVDPDLPNAIHLHRAQGTAQAATGYHTASLAASPLNSSSVTYPYNTLDSSMWAVAVPDLPRPQPQPSPILQVPWYDQNGLPWCTPTSLTEMLHYYNLTPTVSDPVNAAFGSNTALANWQMAAQSDQPAGGGANYDELDNIGIPRISSPTSQGYVYYVWDDNFFLTDQGLHGDYQDFENYIILVNTGFFGLGERKPLALGVDAWWHSVVIVGADGTGLYLHDSNGSIAGQVTWADFQKSAITYKLDDQKKQVVDKHVMWTAVVYGYPIKPEAQRRGSVVITQGGLVSSDSLGNQTRLRWDGQTPHVHGYYLNDPSYNGFINTMSDLGYYLFHSGSLWYGYRIANVTNIPLTFTSAAELSGPTFGSGLVRQVHTTTVQPYAVSNYISGNFTVPASGSTAFFDVKLYESGPASPVQDAKFIRLDIHDPATPTVKITKPANGAHVYAGSAVVLEGSGFDVDTQSSLPWYDLSWSNGSTPLGDGTSISATFAKTGTYIITLTGTNSVGASASASITITVDPALPGAYVTITSPTNGQTIHTYSNTATSYQVTLQGTGSAGMAFTWTDSIDGTLGYGATINAYLAVQDTSNCAPSTRHVITLTGTDSYGRTKTATITIYLAPSCIT